MIFVAVKTEHATALNRGIMRLLRPSHLRGSGWTDLYCDMIKHPQLDYTVLCLPEDVYVPLHIEADGQELAAIMAIFVQDGAITQPDADGIVAAVRAYAGQTVRIADFIPPSWVSNVFTIEQLRAGGWLVSDGGLV